MKHVHVSVMIYSYSRRRSVLWLVQSLMLSIQDFLLRPLRRLSSLIPEVWSLAEGSLETCFMPLNISFSGSPLCGIGRVYLYACVNI